MSYEHPLLPKRVIQDLPFQIKKNVTGIGKTYGTDNIMNFKLHFIIAALQSLPSVLPTGKQLYQRVMNTFPKRPTLKK